MAQTTKIRFALWFVFLALMSSAVPSWGQDLNGSLTGKITDPSHASVPGALATVRNTGRELRRLTPPARTDFTLFPICCAAPIP
jgi:hypothetical protein